MASAVGKIDQEKLQVRGQRSKESGLPPDEVSVSYNVTLWR
jgi:hypothetical protein